MQSVWTVPHEDMRVGETQILSVGQAKTRPVRSTMVIPLGIWIRGGVISLRAAVREFPSHGYGGVSGKHSATALEGL